MTNTTIETAAHELARAAHARYWLEAAGRADWARMHEAIIHREFASLADALGYDVKRREND